MNAKMQESYLHEMQKIAFLSAAANRLGHFGAKNFVKGGLASRVAKKGASWLGIAGKAAKDAGISKGVQTGLGVGALGGGSFIAGRLSKRRN